MAGMKHLARRRRMSEQPLKKEGEWTLCGERGEPIASATHEAFVKMHENRGPEREALEALNERLKVLELWFRVILNLSGTEARAAAKMVHISETDDE
jgi:hypothetical protein